MLAIDDLTKLKITRVRDWRINFKYDGVQYSLNCKSDCESVTSLINWDTKECIKSVYGNLYVNNYIEVSTYNNYNKPLIYSHIDKKHFVKTLYENEFIIPNNSIKKEVLFKKIVELQNEINQKKSILFKYTNELTKLYD